MMDKNRILRGISIVVFSSIFLILISDAQNNSNLVNLPFTGQYRKDSKTSFVKNGEQEIKYEHFDNLSALMKTLPPDDSMRTSFPQITSKDFPRTQQESRNVEVIAYIYGAKLEGDNDLHVVMANSPNNGETVFMNTELSGLPADEGADFDSLIAIRQKFVSIFPKSNFTSGGYATLGLKKVSIRGSLIFDADHTPGCSSCPGPKAAKPKTVWEIHPILGIDVLGQPPIGSSKVSHSPTH